MLIFRHFITILAMVMLSFGFTQAQPHTIRGSVLDAVSREPLVGVSIQLAGLSLGVISDENGRFIIEGISKKLVTVQVNYIGYQPKTIQCDFSKDRNPNLRILLISSTTELIEVEITGKAEGQIKAMIDQKKAESIKNIVSAEQIATFPDMNAAEVMQRIPGITLQRDKGEGRFVQLRGTPPELTNFNINGEQIPSPEGGVRFVGMDLIPADQIDIIEVSKVMTPDMDADGIGGSVNIKTKDAASEIPEIRATMAAGYSNLRQTPNYQVQFAFGQRYKKFGFHINASYYQNNQGTDNIEYDFAKGPFFGSQSSGVDNYFVQFREVQLRYYDITRTRISVAPTFTYHLNEKSTFFLRAMYNSFSDKELRYRKIYELDDALSYEYYLYGGIVHDVKQREKKQELSTISIGGEHKVGMATLDYQLMWAAASEKEPDRLEASFESPGQAIAIRFNLDDPEYPRAEFPNPSNGVNATNYDNFELNDLLFESRKVVDINYTPRINLTIPYRFSANNAGYIKFGGKIRAKDKTRNIESQQFAAYFQKPLGYPGEGPKLSVSSMSDGFRTYDLLNSGYILEAMPSPTNLRNFYEFYPQHFVFDRTATKVQSFGEDFSAKERIYAGYLMLRHDFKNLMAIAGLRYEQTNIDYTGARVVLDKNRFLRIDTLNDQRMHSFLLPQIQMKYAITDEFNLRAALTYTYSRPNFDDVLPYREEDRENVKFGNPDLRYPQSTNIDFLAERYFRKGIISGGLFYKQIDDFIFFFKRFAHEGNPADYGLVEITKAINGQRASVYGLEFQWQTKFNTLPGFLSDFGVYTNYTYTYSQALINKRFPANYTNAVVVFGEDDLSVFSSTTETETVTLPGQAKNNANFAIFYDTPKFFVRLTANYQDAFLYRLGADKDLDEYYDNEFRIDFNANYDLTRHVNVFVDAINLTNTPQRYYLGTINRIKQQEFYSWWCRAGVKLKF